MRERRLNEFKGVILVAAGIILLASLLSFTPFDLSFYTSHPNIPPKNFIRTFGAYLAGMLLFLFGWSSYIIPAITLSLGVSLFKQHKPYLSVARVVGMLVLILSISSLVGMFDPHNAAISFSHGGILGLGIARFVTGYFGRLGGYIIFITLITLSSALVTETLISSYLDHAFTKFNLLKAALLKFKPRLKPKLDFKEAVKKVDPALLLKTKSPVQERQKIAVGENQKDIKPKIQIKTRQQEAPEVKPRQQEIKIGDYQLPSLDLLESPPPLEARQIKEDLEASARTLEETLEDFGISAKVTDIERGPVITRYELEPAPGVKVNRIAVLSDDIALAMKAQSVRIIAPIPGKGRVGVEVPNSQSSFVYLKEVLSSKVFQEARSPLTLALGKDISGQPIIADLDDMPHLLIAGTTGSGKTVCVNSLVLSLLYRATPNDLRFLMVDPKMVELMPFNGLPHLLCPVVTDAKKTSAALNWVVNEMEERYQLLAKAGARNIAAYNEKQEKLPYIVVIIDEFADLMSVASDQIENAVTRLAQLSRAVGIHLVLATQRPSVNVITGVIKANLPARISFKVASKVDSRTVLDMNGADKLLGKGDMLFLRPGESKLIRIQCTLVGDKEINKVVDFIKEQGEPVYDEDIVKEQSKSAIAGGEKDELYDEAVRIIMESNQASVSILQRRMRLGYTRAARIIDTMEQEGLVGPYEGSKPRRILADREEWLGKELLQEEDKE